MITRRRLGKAAALAGAALTASSSRPLETDAKSGKEQMGLDPVQWTLEQYDLAPLRLTFRAKNKAEAVEWQKQLRAKITELIGGFPARTPLKPRTIEVREFPGYRREKFVFESRPGLSVVGYVLIPKSGTAPHASVVCVPGHGRGVDDIVGIDENGRDRTEKPFYERDFAIQVVEHGMAAVALEPMAFGYRRDEITKRKGPGVSACQPAAGSALLLGQTMIGWRVWDVMRTLDWIETRPELDRNRIGCMGISGGGTCAQFSTALDGRIKAAF